MPESFRTWDDYFIPGTDVLRNIPGITDPVKLREFEEARAHLRIIELEKEPLRGEFDYAHMKAIHHHIFCDTYEWAGQERVGPVGRFMQKMGPDVLDPRGPDRPYSYYPAEGIAEAARTEYATLRQQLIVPARQGISPDDFTAALASAWGEINVIHAFREGNTRSQFVFFRQLASHCGYELDPARFRPGEPLREEFISARFHSQATGSNQRLAAVLAQAIHPDTPGRGSDPDHNPEIQAARRRAATQYYRTSPAGPGRVLDPARHQPRTGPHRGPRMDPSAHAPSRRG